MAQEALASRITRGAAGRSPICRRRCRTPEAPPAPAGDHGALGLATVVGVRWRSRSCAALAARTLGLLPPPVSRSPRICTVIGPRHDSRSGPVDRSRWAELWMEPGPNSRHLPCKGSARELRPRRRGRRRCPGGAATCHLAASTGPISTAPARQPPAAGRAAQVPCPSTRTSWALGGLDLRPLRYQRSALTA